MKTYPPAGLFDLLLNVCRLLSFTIFAVNLRKMRFLVFLSQSLALNPNKLRLEKVTLEYDAEYYSYYGSSQDSFTDLDFEVINGKVTVTPQQSAVKFCWNCNSPDISHCREKGFLEKVRFF